MRQPSAAVIVDALAELGVTHVVGLPDNASAALFSALQADDRIALLTVAREGEAFALASGLWVGGAAPLVVVQNTGLLESGDSLRGTAVRMGVPLPVIVTYRGYAKMLSQRLAGVALERELLVRSDVDSVALMTEPTLDAWGIGHDVYESDGDVERLHAAWTRAHTDERPVAILLTVELV